MMFDKRFQKSVCLRHVPGCHENISGFVLFLLVDQAHDDYTVEIFHGDRITAIEHEKDRLAQSQRICVFFVEIGIVCKDIDSIRPVGRYGRKSLSGGSLSVGRCISTIAR